MPACFGACQGLLFQSQLDRQPRTDVSAVCRGRRIVDAGGHEQCRRWRRLLQRHLLLLQLPRVQLRTCAPKRLSRIESSIILRGLVSSDGGEKLRGTNQIPPAQTQCISDVVNRKFAGAANAD